MTGGRADLPPPPPGAGYICPMHPEVAAPGPAACPKCGMALEPEAVSAAPAPDPELRAMTLRFWIGAALTAPLAALAMAGHVPGVPAGWLPPYAVSVWVQFALATPVVLWGGGVFFARGWASIRSGNLNMFTLIAVGTGAAYLYSAAAALAPAAFPAAFAGPGGIVPVYFEAAAMIVVLVLLGQILELRARARAGDALRALLDLAPETAVRLDADGGAEEAALDSVLPGDRLRVRPGDRVPVDGAVLEGSGVLDESMVTGEPLPVEKSAGALVIGGTVNRAGSFVMRADRVGAETMLARIVALVAEAQRSRAPVQRLADRVAGWFVPAVAAVAAAAFAGWAAAGPPPALTHALIAAVSVLIVACPCAIGLAAPLSVMVAAGRGARAGVLFRSAEALEALAGIDTLVVDKTGTLTEGRPAVVGLEAADGVSEDEVLRLAASLERGSGHPLARAAAAAAAARGLALEDPVEFRHAAGKGVAGAVGGRAVVVGNAVLLSEHGLDPGPLSARAEALREDGATAVFVAVDGRVGGLIAFADPVRASAAPTLEALRRAGVEIRMLTGDDPRTAASVAARLGIKEVAAGLLPEDKSAAVRRLKEDGRKVAMAGDGVNDAPALAAADVGIALAGGSDVAVESASVTLVGGDLAGVARARRLARAAMRNVRQNLFFAFVYNLLGVPVAAGALYPFFGVLLDPVAAAAAMSLSSVSVVGNALRLSRARL